MKVALTPIRSGADYAAALEEVARVVGGEERDAGGGDRLDILATLIYVYEAGHHPMDPP